MEGPLPDDSCSDDSITIHSVSGAVLIPEKFEIDVVMIIGESILFDVMAVQLDLDASLATRCATWVSNRLSCGAIRYRAKGVNERQEPAVRSEAP